VGPAPRLQEAVVSKTFVETSTELLEGLDEMIREGYYANRTEGINDAIRMLLKQYKLSKLHDKDSQVQKTAERSPVAGGGSMGG
jgi:metal-responsive CopG/Arc/MetJ family transcriptional regulator